MRSGAGNTRQELAQWTPAWLNSAARWMMTLLNHALSRLFQVRAIVSLRLSMERGKILAMFRKRRLYLFLLSLPIWVGLILSLLASWLFRPNSSFLYPTEFG